MIPNAVNDDQTEPTPRASAPSVGAERTITQFVR